MKKVVVKFFSLLFILTSLPNCVFSSEYTQLVTDVLITDNDSVFRHSFLYDNMGNKMLETVYFQQGDNWLRLTQNEWMYEDSRCVKKVERKWSNNLWINNFTFDYGYSNGVLSSELKSHFLDANSVPSSKTDYLYISGKLNELKVSEFSNNAWKPLHFTKFSYLPNGKVDTVKIGRFQLETEIILMNSKNYYTVDNLLDSQEIKEINEDGETISHHIVKWYYFQGTNLVQIQWNKDWNFAESKWENTQKITYNYNEQNQCIEEIYQHWETMFWENVARYTYDYNTELALAKRSLSFPIYKQWRNALSVQYFDFENEQPKTIESKYEYWGGDPEELTSSFIPFYLHDELVIEKAQKIEFVNLPYIETGLEPNKNSISDLVYPNPSEGIFYLNPTNHRINSWTLTDLNGQILKSCQTTYLSGVIDLSEFSKGIYLLKIETQEGLLVQKIIRN